jgi:hypothetical protein
MSVTLTVNKMTSSLQKIQKKLDNLPKEAFAEFVKDTPIRTGNARRKTKLSGNKIIAGYNYAQKLDSGSSRQAPQGMTKPTEDFIQKRTQQILKGK